MMIGILTEEEKANDNEEVACQECNGTGEWKESGVVEEYHGCNGVGMMRMNTDFVCGVGSPEFFPPDNPAGKRF